jgi:galactose mutarotase-like enzyme
LHEKQLICKCFTVSSQVADICCTLFNPIMVTIRNKFLTAAISEAGAELQQLRHINGIDYMWNADAQHWAKHSPVLFPIVGSLVNSSYSYKGLQYKLPRHGFARDHVFEVLSQAEDKVVFALASNEQTKAVYPFDFELRLLYELKESSLHCTYQVINKGAEEMLFSVGGHPAFALPLEDGLKYEDYHLEFDQDEPLMRCKLQDGLISARTELLPSAGGRLMLHPSLFYEDAIVLKHLKSEKVTLKADHGKHGLHFHYSGFPYLGIWAAKDAPFVCIEPWCGHADNVGHDQQLETKEGIERLASGSSWQRTWMVDCF